MIVVQAERRDISALIGDSDFRESNFQVDQAMIDSDRKFSRRRKMTTRSSFIVLLPLSHPLDLATTISPEYKLSNSSPSKFRKHLSLLEASSKTRGDSESPVCKRSLHARRWSTLTRRAFYSINPPPPGIDRVPSMAMSHDWLPRLVRARSLRLALPEQSRAIGSSMRRHGPALRLEITKKKRKRRHPGFRWHESPPLSLYLSPLFRFGGGEEKGERERVARRASSSTRPPLGELFQVEPGSGGRSLIIARFTTSRGSSTRIDERSGTF